MSFAFFNNQILPTEEIRISPYDLGILRGYGVFDFVRTYKKKPFKLEEHLDRFERSASIIGLSVPKTKEEIVPIVQELITLNGFKESNIRLVLTGGESPDSRTVTKPTFYILIEPLKETDPLLLEKGVRIKTIEYLRNSPGAKTTDYQMFFKAQNQWGSEGWVEYLYTQGGNVLEGATSNICAFFGSTLVTPKNNILPGVTKEVVLDIASSHWHIEERNLTLKELLAADEVFLTATNKEIMPVVYIDSTIINTGTPGPRTRKLMELFKEYIKQI